MGRGRLITFEGGDGLGKSTQTERLGKCLGGKIEKFPNRTSNIGQILDKHLTGKDVIESTKAEHLLMAANRAERELAIIENLDAGFDVLTDRFYASGIAYTSAKEIDGLVFRKREDLYNWAKLADRGIIEPDITFYFKSEINFKKSGENREIYENEAFQKRVCEQFEKIKNEKKNWVEIRVDQYENKIEELSEVLLGIIAERKETDSSFRFNSL